MKSIVIVGAGIGGCTTYLYLKKHLLPHIPDLSVHIFESHSPPSQVNSSHADVTAVSSSPPNTADRGEESGLAVDTATDVTTALGGGLGLSPNGIRVFESLDPAICARIKAAGHEVDVFGMHTSSGRSLGNFVAGGSRYGHGTLLVMRAAVHDAVIERVDKKDISFKRKVKRVVDGETMARVDFEDGSSIEADLVIGADGVWGKTRLAIPESAGFKPEYE